MDRSVASITAGGGYDPPAEASSSSTASCDRRPWRRRVFLFEFEIVRCLNFKARAP